MSDNKRTWDFSNNPYLQYIFIGVVLCMLPVLSEIGILKSSSITIIASVLIYTFAALGLSLLLGYSGLISLGTAGFMGLGAYLSAFFTENLGLPFFLSLILAIIIPLVIGLLVGLISLRIEGLYLAIATLCVSEILRKTFEEFEVVTNGFAGKSANYPSFFGFALGKNSTYVFIVILLVIMLIVTYNIVNSYIGRAFLAMRGSEVAAQAMGINLLKYRLMSFALATIYAALAGVMYAHFIKYIYPSTWSMPLSLNILAIIVIGGMRSIPGTLLGAFVVFGIPDLILKQLPVIGEIEGVAYIFNGILIIIVVLFYPNGVSSIINDAKKLLTKKKGDKYEPTGN